MTTTRSFSTEASHDATVFAHALPLLAQLAFVRSLVDELLRRPSESTETALRAQLDDELERMARLIRGDRCDRGIACTTANEAVRNGLA